MKRHVTSDLPHVVLHPHALSNCGYQSRAPFHCPCSPLTHLGPLPCAQRNNSPFPNPANLCSPQWDHCLSTLLIRSTLGASFGVIFSVLLFKRRAWPAFVGFGFGAGRAWEECDSSFKRAAAPSRDGLRVLRP
ncbi:hypothetical protein BDV97DRAFT_293779 [Delphinella strobiligena]|nr:hypothetical protein BDV97DRAFT_293779 [Delphinella strobiligena]